MEPYRQGGSASSNPAADLEAHLRAMQLGDPSSSASNLQPHHHAAIPPLLLNHHQQQVLARAPPLLNHQQQQVLARAPPPPLNYHQQQVLARAPPPQVVQYPPPVLLPHPHPHQQARSYFGDGGGFFPDAGYASTVGAYFSFGVNPTSFNVPGASTLWAAPGPSNPSTSVEEYRRNSSSTSAHPRALRAGADRFPLTQEEVKYLLVQASMVRDLVMSAESSPHVVQLLAEGDAMVLHGVIAGIRHVVHKVMKDDVGGHDVFLQLLRACDGKHEELKMIIDDVCNGKGVLMKVLNTEYLGLGLKALEELIRMMALPLNRPLCERLIRRLLEKERLLQDRTGDVVLHRCFTMLPHEECSLIIKHALNTIDEVLFSRFGWRSLAECFANAQGDDLKNLEVIVLTRTSEIAKDRSSANLLRYLLLSGSEHLKPRIVDCVAADILDLARDEYGSYVVETCLSSPEPVQRVLEAFLNLERSDLPDLVHGWWSNYVIRKLLQTGKNFHPKLTKTLARRIEGMSGAARRQKDAERVLRLIDDLFPLGEGSASV